MKAFLSALCVVYLILLAASLAGMHFIGERHVLTGTMLFFPLIGWILPAVVLFVPCAVWDRLTGLLLASLIAWYGLIFMSPEFNDWEDRKPGDLTLLSCNLGQDSIDELQPFVERERPDVIALQEVNNRKSEYSRAFPGYEVHGTDQFPLLSRYPILDGRYIRLGLTNRREPCAGRYVVDYNGRQVLIFNVHLPTPRWLLEDTWDQPHVLLPEVFEEQYPGPCNLVEEGWENRVAQLNELIGVLKKETLPMIVVGDFNMPAHGTSYQRMAKFMTDAFTVRGRGYGFTFPADREPLQSLIAPWVRLDYQFVSRDWRTGYFRLEYTRRAQHRATVARYRLRGVTRVGFRSGNHAKPRENAPPQRDFPAHSGRKSAGAPHAQGFRFHPL
jgi:endonuclease/exonuclease/phosphatase family metal-dependent hydrolase